MQTPPVETNLPRKTAAFVQRKDGRELRRFTIYLPCDLARSLRLYCAEREVEMSAVVAAALSQLLHAPQSEIE